VGLTVLYLNNIHQGGFSLMPIALFVLALCLAANVVLGPLGMGLIQWRVSPIGLNQTLGIDAALFVLGVPLTLAAAWMWRIGHRFAPPLALGSSLCVLYYAIAETMGPDYIRYPGNNERFFPLVLALIILSWTIAFRAWSTLDSHPPVPPTWLRRALAVVLALGGLALGWAWMAQLVDIAVTGSLSEAYLDAPSAFWIVRIVDLGFLVPLMLATSVGLWRSHPTAIKAAYGLTTFLTLQAAAVLAMAAVMAWRQDPTATPELALVLTPLSLALGVLTALLLASYARRPTADRGQGVPTVHAPSAVSPG
jgi:hypothetical protein